jgi:hypothetical protein
LDIHFTVGTSCERAASLAEKNAAARHYVLRSLHNEHRVFRVVSERTFQLLFTVYSKIRQLLSDDCAVEFNWAAVFLLELLSFFLCFCPLPLFYT